MRNVSWQKLFIPAITIHKCIDLLVASFSTINGKYVSACKSPKFPLTFSRVFSKTAKIFIARNAEKSDNSIRRWLHEMQANCLTD